MSTFNFNFNLFGTDTNQDFKFDANGLLSPDEMYFPTTDVNMMDFNQMNLDSSTQLSPNHPTSNDGIPNLTNSLFDPMFDFTNFDMKLSQSPLGSPYDEVTQNMMMMTSPTYNTNWNPKLYGNRRASTPCSYAELLANANAYNVNPLQVPDMTMFNATYPPPTTTTDKLSSPQPRMNRRASCSTAIPTPTRRRNSTSKGTESPKSFHCTELNCDKIFKRSEHLKRHLKSIHSGTKPYQCTFPTCKKSFSRADNLGQHMRIHRNPNDKLKSKGVTSATPYLLTLASTMEEELAYPLHHHQL